MAEEFQESEVIFQDSVDDEHSFNHDCRSFQLSCHESRNGNGKRRRLKAGLSITRSVPVSIPVNASRNKWWCCVDSEFYDGNDGEMVPPHVIIGRRVAGKMMAFSICTGKGIVLKGRDLSEFRNLILRLTGFLET